MIRSRIIQAAGKFHREEEAQISFLAIAGFICFVGLLAMVINTNDMVTERVHMQDVADVTALSAAAWTARGLNLASFVNVLNSKLVTTAVLMNALKDSLPVIIAVGQVQQKIFSACSTNPWTAWFCVPMNIVVTTQLTVLNYLDKAVKKMAEQLSKCPNGKLWTMMKGLEKSIEGVKTTFVGIGFAEAMEIAKANGATQGFAVNGKLASGKGIFLPIDNKKSKFNQFCPKMDKGGPGYELQGYACDEGPLPLGKERIRKTLLAPFFNLLSWPIFDGMVVSHVTQVGCKAIAGKNAGVKVQLQDLTECKKYDEEAIWGHVFSYTEELADGSLGLDDFVPWKPKNKYKGSKGEEEVFDPEKEGIGKINLPEGMLEGGGESTGPSDNWGRGLQYIKKENEKSGPYPNAHVSCSGSALPSYGHVGEWDNLEPGVMWYTPVPQICGLGCKRIDKYTGVFKAYDHNHRPVSRINNIGGYYIRVTRKKIEREGEDPKYRYIVETISLVSAGETTMSPKEHEKYLKERLEKEQADGLKTEGSQSSAGCSEDKKPKPWMLDKGTSKKSKEDFADQLRYFSLVYKNVDENPPFWSTFFDTPPERIVAYSQAQVYNHLSEDTFTQDWRVRLEQATLLEEYLQKVGFSGMKSSSKSLGTINNH